MQQAQRRVVIPGQWVVGWSPMTTTVRREVVAVDRCQGHCVAAAVATGQCEKRAREVTLVLWRVTVTMAENTATWK